MSRDLLFEIGVEELPAGYVPPALEQLERAVRDGLEALRLGCGGVVSHGTPRRLTVVVHRVDDRQSDFDEEAMGPATKVAFDPEGRHPRLERRVHRLACRSRNRAMEGRRRPPSRTTVCRVPQLRGQRGHPVAEDPG